MYQRDSHRSASTAAPFPAFYLVPVNTHGRDYDFYSEINGPRMFQSHDFRLLQDDGSLLTRTQTKKQPRLILPQHHYLQEIHEQFPNATFLLNLRPTQQRVASTMRWGTTLHQQIPNEFVAQDIDRGFAVGDGDILKHYGIANLPPQFVFRSQCNPRLYYGLSFQLYSRLCLSASFPHLD